MDTAPVITADQVQTMMSGSVQTASPTTGQTILMSDDSRTGSLIMTPAGTLATLTVTLPTDANSIVGQERTIFSSKAITTFTLNGATTIFGNTSTLNAGDCITFKKVAANTWARKI